MADISLKPKLESPIIPKEIYGQFAEHLGGCIYGGLWVGEDSPIPNTRGIRTDVVEALKAIRLPVLRWPGGCFADEYHWMDGIGPREDRPSMYNSHWGGVVENNHFGTHEFFDLCEQIGCQAYVCGNVGSGTVREMSEWVEYITSPAESPMANLRRKNGRQEPWRMEFFGVGNESWGCGGSMRPEYYADLYRRYNTFVRTYGPHRITRIACGANTSDYRWTEVLMENAAHHMDGLSLHNYTLLDKKWPPSGSATEFGEKEWYSILNAAAGTEELVVKHGEIMDRFDPEKRVNLVVDEWGTWHPVEPGTNPGFLYQQNTMRDALVASVHFDLFHRHCDRVRMTNIAQMVNVLQAMVLTDGAKMCVTPTYWVFEMYAPHQGARRVDVEISGAEQIGGDFAVSSVSATASDKDGFLTLSLSNLRHDREERVSINLPEGAKLEGARVLHHQSMNSFNTPDDPNQVAPAPLAGSNNGEEFVLPAASVATIRYRL